MGLCPNSHFEGDEFEPNECHTEATSIEAITPQAHSISPSGDHDWFRLDPAPQHIYRFEVDRDSLPNAILYLYQGEGLRYIYSQSSTYEITHEVEDEGPYYYKVSAYNQRGTGDYTVILSDLGPDDHGDVPAAATPLNVGEAPLLGDVETRGDDDWFSFEAIAGRIYHFALTRETISSAYVYLYYPDGQRIAESHSDPESITYETDESGRWYYRVRHSSGSGIGSYHLTLDDVGEDDHGDEEATATPLVMDGPLISGEIKTRGDLDYFSFVALLNHSYRVSLIPISLSSSNLRLYDPSGSRAAISISSVLLFEADEAGQWTIQVRHPSSIGTGEYEVRVEDLGLIETP